MWYALGQIKEPTPVIRVVQVARPKPRPMLKVAPVQVQTVKTRTAYTTHCQPVPGYLQKMVVIPTDYQVSELSALRLLAHKMGLHFAYAGPDYALYDTDVPFGRPVTVLRFIQSVINSYVPGVMFIWHDTLTVENLPPCYVKSGSAIQ